MKRCGCNITIQGQNQRLRLGVILLGLGLLTAVVLVELQAPLAWRSLVFVPFFLAAFGALQGLYKTCVFHAMSGTRDTQNGLHPVADPEQAALNRRVSRVIVASSLALALIATVPVLLLV